MQWLTKIKWKKTGPGTEENTRNTQKQARKTTGKTEKAEKGEAKMTPNCRETSKTVQLYLCEVSPNKYVCNPPYYRETKFILLKNIAKRRLPTPLRISGKKKTIGGKGKVLRGIRGPQGPSRRKTICFWNPVPEKKSTPLSRQKWYSPRRDAAWSPEQTIFRRLGPRGPLMPFTIFCFAANRFLFSFKFLKD